MIEQEIIIKDFFVAFAAIICVLLLIFIYIKNSKFFQFSRDAISLEGLSYWFEKIDVDRDWQSVIDTTNYEIFAGEEYSYWYVDLFEIRMKTDLYLEGLYLKSKLFIFSEENYFLESVFRDIIHEIEVKYKNHFEKNSKISFIYDKSKKVKKFQSWIRDPILIRSLSNCYLNTILYMIDKYKLGIHFYLNFKAGFYLEAVLFGLEDNEDKVKKIIEEMHNMIGTNCVENGEGFRLIFCIAYEGALPEFLGHLKTQNVLDSEENLKHSSAA